MARAGHLASSQPVSSSRISKGLIECNINIRPPAAGLTSSEQWPIGGAQAADPRPVGPLDKREEVEVVTETRKRGRRRSWLTSL